MCLANYIAYIKNVVAYFSAAIIPMALNLAINPLIAMNMSPEDYAITGYFASYTPLIAPIIIFYLVHYFIKEYFRLDEDSREKLIAVIVKTLIWFSGCISIVCFGLLFIVVSVIGVNFPIMPYLAMIVFAIPLTGIYSLRITQYRMEKNNKGYFCLCVGHGVLTAFFSLFFVVMIKWGALGKLLAPLLSNAIVFVYVLYTYKRYLKVSYDFALFKKIFVFCIPLALSAMLGYFNNGFTTTYLEKIGNNTEYGYYVVGLSIGTYLTVFATAVADAFQPDLYESIIKKFWSKYFKLCVFEIAILVVVAATFIWLAPYIISILTAGRYIDSTPYAQIIAISIVTSNIYYLVNNYSIATNRPRMYLYTTIVGSVVMIVCLPLVVAKFEYVGGCWMSVVSFIVFAIINIFFLFLSLIRAKVIAKKNLFSRH